MIEHNLKRYVTAIVVVFLLFFIIICTAKKSLPTGFIDYLRTMSAAISITTIIVTIFVSWAWKYRIFRGWLVPVPNLNGDWEGCIKYNYAGKDTSRKIKVHIKQTFTSIIVKLETKESKSKNFCGSFNIDRNRDEKQLIYSYFNEPDMKLRERSPLHYGTTKLDISQDNKTMEGEYWTNRNSGGTITLKKSTRK